MYCRVLGEGGGSMCEAPHVPRTLKRVPVASRGFAKFIRNKSENRCVVVTEAGSYLRFIDFFITQLKAPGPSRTCNESKEEEEEEEQQVLITYSYLLKGGQSCGGLQVGSQAVKARFDTGPRSFRALSVSYPALY